jgi:hypothetical protein
MTDKLISLKDVAKAIGIPAWTLRNWIKSNCGIRFKRLHSERYVTTQQQVQEWVNSLPEANEVEGEVR